jgi:hypothetical protein
MSAVEELTQLCAALPAEKVAEVLDFARFLQSRPTVPGEAWQPEPEGPGDVEWERIIADPRPRPKLDAFMKAAFEESPSELLTEEAFDRHEPR